MKLIIQKPKNGYAGWHGWVVDEKGDRHLILKATTTGMFAFETREQLVKAAKKKAALLRAA